jgi:hypothetical protein
LPLKERTDIMSRIIDRSEANSLTENTGFHTI